MNGGIGTDIIEILRIAAAIERHGQRFLDRVFTKKEQAYCDSKAHPATHYAARFAAKEAVSKALGGVYSWLDIEIRKDEKGRPYPSLADKYGTPPLQISMSHCKEYATAVALLHD